MRNLFLSHEHESRFLELRQKIVGLKKLEDKQVVALAFLLSANEDIEQKIFPYLKLNKFHYEEMFKEQDFTGETELLAKLAVLIYNGEEDFSFSALYRTLSNVNLQLALNSAFLLYRSEPSTTYQTTDTNSYIK